jgi:hypothetical protein
MERISSSGGSQCSLADKAGRWQAQRGPSAAGALHHGLPRSARAGFQPSQSTIACPMISVSAVSTFWHDEAERCKNTL